LKNWQKKLEIWASLSLNMKIFATNILLSICLACS
jgi:hypothetical protein